MKTQNKSVLTFSLGVAVGMIVATCLHTHNFYCVCSRESTEVSLVRATLNSLDVVEDTSAELEHRRVVDSPQEKQPSKCNCDCHGEEDDRITAPVGEEDEDDNDSFGESPALDFNSLQDENSFSDEPWEFFNDQKVYNGLMTKPSYDLKVHLSINKELEAVRAELANAASGHFKKNMKVTAISDAYLRRDPLQGTEYIFDVQLTEADSLETYPLNVRIELLRMFVHKLNVSVTRYEAELDTVNFIVPVMNIGERFDIFMQTYEKQFLQKREKVRLILIVYGKGSLIDVNKTLLKYHKLHPSANITVIEKPSSQYSKSKALDTGIAELKDSDLAFFCDVDIQVHHAFAQRCRRNAIKGERVYFPEVFKMYNLDYVYWNKKRPSNPYTATRAHGHWGSYGFGMVCVYKSDYLKVGGLNTDIVGWGGEDVDFYKRVNDKMNSMQAPDTALWHRWHPKECSPQLSKSQYDNCIGSRSESLADKKELASLIYERGIKP